MSLKNDLWIWGQDAGTHHGCHDNAWKLPGENKMGPVEGAKYLGIPNVCRVAMGGLPVPPFDDEAEKLKDVPKVVWSVIGDYSTDRTNGGGTDIDYVVDVAGKYKNIIGGITDDLFVGERLEVYTPQILGDCAKKLHDAGLEFWCVSYEKDLKPEIIEHLACFDVVTLWTWHADNLQYLDRAYETLKKLMKPGQKVYAGCYFWDYGDSRPMTMDAMKYQLEKYRQWYDEGKISGIIFCSNCIADIGLDTVEYTRKWIAEL